MHSSIEKILIVSKNLPPPLRAIFDGLFMQNKNEEVICAEQAITMDEFKSRRETLMREIRSSVH
jgi:hypothetical protein